MVVSAFDRFDSGEEMQEMSVPSPVLRRLPTSVPGLPHISFPFSTLITAYRGKTSRDNAIVTGRHD